MASATIGMRYRACTSAFERLRVDLEEGHLGECHVAPLPAVQHEFGRFQIWAGDAGVTGTGRESLEHRLRDYEDVHDAIVDLLDDLHSQLVKFIKLCSRPRNPLDFEGSHSDSSTDTQSLSSGPDGHRTESEQLLRAINEIICLLFQLSIELHDGVSNTSTQREATLSASQAAEEDLRLVIETFPRADASLRERLAKAVTARYVTLDKNLTIKSVEEETDDTVTEISSPFSESSTISLAAFGRAWQTSEEARRRPDFVCPFCSHHVGVTNEKHWRSHILRDLKPYICTFSDCVQGSRLIGSRREWFNHEARVHRKRWLCNACQENYLSRADFVSHLKLRHGNLSTPVQLDALAEMCERPMDRDGLAQCPFCLKEDQHFRSHVASHMSDLAFAALRRYEDRQNSKGRRPQRKAIDADASMSSSTSSAKGSEDGLSKKPTSKTIAERRRKDKVKQQGSSNVSNSFSQAFAALRDSPLGANRETVVRSLRKTLNHDTEHYEENLLNYVADLQISHAVLENRVRMIEVDRGREGRRPTSMKMLKLLKFDQDVPINDTDFCANGYYTLDQAAKGRASWVARSEKIRQWLASVASGGLLVHGNSDASLRKSPLSLLCAKAIGILSAKQNVFVIRYFCGLHTRTNHPQDDAVGMVNSLLGQLILQYDRLGLDLDLAGLDPEDLRGAKDANLPGLLTTFRHCVLQVPYAYSIYCFIDGISFHETAQRREATLEVIYMLRRIILNARHIAFKLLVTAPGRSQSVHRLFRQSEILDVPQYIPSDAQGLFEHGLSGLAKVSAETHRPTQENIWNEELQWRRDWENRNGSRESLVSVEA